MIRRKRDVLRSLGASDAKTGKPIEAFHALKLTRFPRLNESLRAEYEIGYRAEKAEILKQPKEKK